MKIGVGHALIESKFRYSIILWRNNFQYNTEYSFLYCEKRPFAIARFIQCWTNHTDSIEWIGYCTKLINIMVLLTGLWNEDQIQREGSRKKDLKNMIEPKLNIETHCPPHQSAELFNKLPMEFKSIKKKTKTL